MLLHFTAPLGNTSKIQFYLQLYVYLRARMATKRARGY
jgi:hypothetical protein